MFFILGLLCCFIMSRTADNQCLIVEFLYLTNSDGGFKRWLYGRSDVATLLWTYFHAAARASSNATGAM